MTCAELDILLCDYVDQTLNAAQKSVVEEHLAHCASCAELVRDASAAVTFIGSVAEVEPPQELMTRLMFSVAPAAKQSRGVRAKLMRWLEPVLQPRFAMGMAMTILSFSMLAPFRQCPGAATAAERPESDRDLGVARRQDASHLGARPQVLREYANVRGTQVPVPRIDRTG